MSTRTTLVSSRYTLAFAWRQIRCIGPLGVILLLHAAFFIALQSGLIRQSTHFISKEVFATFVTPELALPQPPKMVTPKIVPITKKAPPSPRPVSAVNNTLSERAISSIPTAAPQQYESTQLDEPIQIIASTPTRPATPTQPRMIAGVEYLQAPRPEYPAVAKRMNEEGKVILKVLINEQGRSEHIEIQKSSGSSRLDEAARQALIRALFKPYMEDGKVMSAYAIVPINFQLSTN